MFELNQGGQSMTKLWSDIRSDDNITLLPRSAWWIQDL